MKSKQQSPIWPYLGILACLFVLSITAPRAWNRAAHDESLHRALANRKTRANVAASADKTIRYEQADRSELAPRTPLVADESWSVPVPKVVEPEISTANRTDTEEAPALQEASILPAAPVEEPHYERTLPADDVMLGEVHPGALEPSLVETAPVVPDPPVAPQEVTPAPEYASEFATPRQSDPPMLADNESEDSESSRPSEPDYEPAVATSAFPLPQALVSQLLQLAQEEPSALWAQQTLELVYKLCTPSTEPGPTTVELLRQLRNVSVNAPNAAMDPPLEILIARTQYAMSRWLDIWSVAAIAPRITEIKTADNDAAADDSSLLAAIAAVDTLTRKGATGKAWREYLQVDALRDLADPQSDAHAEQRREVARRVLDRLESTQLSRPQRQFIANGPVAKLQKELRVWATEPISMARLMADLEKYERTNLASDAQAVADDYRALHWADTPEAEQLSKHVDTHYRNANLRVAVSGQLLNRMVPQPQAIEAPVRDRVVNVPVYGTSTTFTKLFVRLVPDPRRIRIGMEAEGLVASDTVSTSGPATLYNEGQSTFLVRKLLVLGPQGLAVWPAVAEAENNFNYLVSLETDFDGVPLVGSLVRNIARNQHEQVRDEARMEVEQKIAIRARDQLDAEMRPHLIKAAESIEQKQAATLHRLGMELAPVNFSTTEERVAARLRLGSPRQLGAHTPRPRAPSDSWFSMQLHESSLNNVLEQLDLDGRAFSLQELFAWVAEKLDKPELNNLEDLPENVHLTFAPQDAIRLHCKDGHIEVTFAFSELTQGRNRWRDFTVRSLYRPQAQGLNPCFVRDGTISLDGKTVRGKAQPVLRSIFSKVMSRNRDLSLLGEQLTSDPRVQDLDVTQFVVEDGWIGLAYSPRRVRSNVARQPK